MVFGLLLKYTQSPILRRKTLSTQNKNPDAYCEKYNIYMIIDFLYGVYYHINVDLSLIVYCRVFTHTICGVNTHI